MVVVVGLLLASVLSLWKGSHESERRRLHYLTVTTLIMTVIFLAGFHGATGYGWKAFVVISNLTVTLLAETGLYISYVFASAQYASYHQGNHLPSWFAPSFQVVGVLCALSQILGVSLVLATNDYTYVLLLHIPISIVLMFASGVSAVAVWRLKKMLARLNTLAYDSLEPIGSDRIQTTLTRVLFVLTPISMLGLASVIVLSLRAIRIKKSYSSMLRAANSHFTIEDSIISDWSIVALEFFYVFYITSNSGACEAFLNSSPISGLFPVDSTAQSRRGSMHDNISEENNSPGLYGDTVRSDRGVMSYGIGDDRNEREMRLSFPDDIDEG